MWISKLYQLVEIIGVVTERLTIPDVVTSAHSEWPAAF